MIGLTMLVQLYPSFAGLKQFPPSDPRREQCPAPAADAGSLGWFSIHETNQDTYRQEKLKKLLVRTLRYSLWVVERGNSRKNVGRCSLLFALRPWYDVGI